LTFFSIICESLFHHDVLYSILQIVNVWSAVHLLLVRSPASARFFSALVPLYRSSARFFSSLYYDFDIFKSTFFYGAWQYRSITPDAELLTLARRITST